MSNYLRLIMRSAPGPGSESERLWPEPQTQFTAQSEMPIHYLGPREVHTFYPGAVLCVISICPKITRHGTNL